MVTTIKGATEYRVKKVERYIVTRFEASFDGAASSNDIRQIGNEFSNPDTAYEVGYALARQEAELKGYGPGDMRIIYPTHPHESAMPEAEDRDPLNKRYAA